MQRKRILVIVVSLWAGMMFWAGVAAAQNLPLLEANLPASSYQNTEINLGPDGFLYISESGLDHLWQVDPTSGQYQRYAGLTDVTNAKADGAGRVWYTNNGMSFSYLSLADSQVHTWSVSSALALRGIDFDSQNRVWLGDEAGNSLYRFDLSARLLCTYTISGGIPSHYLLVDADQVWLADWITPAKRILRLDPENKDITEWMLSDSAHPYGLAMSTDGRLWWADTVTGGLLSLDADATQNNLNLFALPMGSKPYVLAFQGGSIWYTEYTTGQAAGTVGVLDPAAAVSQGSTITSTTSKINDPDCDIVPAPAPLTRNPIGGKFTWLEGSLDPAYTDAGWTIYALPNNSKPYGLAIDQDVGWVLDYGRDKLVGLGAVLPEKKIYIPLIMR